MEAKFTSGPWSASPYLALGDFTIYGAAREEVAVVNANNGLDEPDWYPSAANAALIAAAPELYEALKAARWYAAFYEAARHREGREDRPTDHQNTTHLSAIDAALSRVEQTGKRDEVSG